MIGGDVETFFIYGLYVHMFIYIIQCCDVEIYQHLKNEYNSGN